MRVSICLSVCLCVGEWIGSLITIILLPNDVCLAFSMPAKPYEVNRQRHSAYALPLLEHVTLPYLSLAYLGHLQRWSEIWGKVFKRQTRLWRQATVRGCCAFTLSYVGVLVVLKMG